MNQEGRRNEVGGRKLGEKKFMKFFNTRNAAMTKPATVRVGK